MSPLGNGEGKSRTVTFTVNTEAPTVTLNEESVKKLSNDRNPAFDGLLKRQHGSGGPHLRRDRAEGTEVARATAKGDSGTGRLGPVTRTGCRGPHLHGCRDGGQPAREPRRQSKSYPFTVDTESPKVELSELPTKESNDRNPSFTGSSNAETEVIVHVYEGAKRKCTEVATAMERGPAALGKRVPLNHELPVGDHNYTAVATEESPLGNPEGKSEAVTFIVNTEPPNVALNPAIGGEGIERQDTGVQRHRERLHRSRGARLRRHAPEGKEVAHAGTAGTGGAWATGPVAPELTAASTLHGRRDPDVPDRQRGRQEQPRPVHRQHRTAEGRTEAESVAKRSNNRKPVFSGTSNTPEPEVVVHIFEGATEVAQPTAKVSEENWKKLRCRQNSRPATAPTRRPRRRPARSKCGRQEQDGSVHVDTAPPRSGSQRRTPTRATRRRHSAGQRANQESLRSASTLAAKRKARR